MLCFFSQVKREDLKGKEILSVNEKYYLMDHGFYKALLGDNNHNEGQKIENIVYNELLRRDYAVTVGKYDDLEIDFVGKKKQLHNLCSSLRNFKRRTYKRKRICTTTENQ